MQKMSKGVGLFTADNIIAIIKAIPETNGSYKAVADKANEYGADVTGHTIASWVTAGNADIRRRKMNTAYARFARRYSELTRSHCQPDDNRNREMDRAMNTLRSECECGNTKGVLPNGQPETECALCRERDSHRERAA